MPTSLPLNPTHAGYPTLSASQSEALTRLPRYFTCQSVIDDVFSGDPDALIRAWCAGAIPLAIWQQCESSLGTVNLERLLLKRIVHLLGG